MAVQPPSAPVARRGVRPDGLGRVSRSFKWAVSEEIVPPSVHEALRSVPGLRRGRTGVRESEPVRPVPEASVDAVLPYVPRQVAAMIQLKRLTGMRPGEVCRMRTADIDTPGPVWLYTTASHETEHHGRDRRVYLGPLAQDVVRPWLRPDSSESPFFSPSKATVERMARLRRYRTTCPCGKAA